MWRVTPKEGAQLDRENLPMVDVSIVLHWKRKGNPVEYEQHPIWMGHLAIHVTKPLISIKDLKLSAMLNTFIGSGLSIPFIYDRIKERKKKVQPKRKSKSSQK